MDWGTCAGDPPGSLWQRACTLGVRGEPAAAVPCCIGGRPEQSSRDLAQWTGGLPLPGLRLGDLSAAIHVLTYLEST